MEYRPFGKLDLRVSAVGLGTWVMGGWLWGSADEKEAEAAVEAAIAGGVTLIDTAPVYGFGVAEEIVGRVVKRLKARDRVVLATKFGLEWDKKKQTIKRNSSCARLLKEIDDSRKRLKTDVIDIYQVHWPDESVPFQETMENLYRLYLSGVIRAIGVSNFSVAQMTECMKSAPLHSLQPPYNLFERGIEEEILPFCQKNAIAVLSYGAICRGLLSGKFKTGQQFPPEDIRSWDPKFRHGTIEKYLAAAERLKTIAKEKKATTSQLAIQWAARRTGVTAALAGARNVRQARENAGAFGFELNAEDMARIEAIVAEEVPNPIGPEFMAPPRSLP